MTAKVLPTTCINLRTMCGIEVLRRILSELSTEGTREWASGCRHVPCLLYAGPVEESSIL
uniref:Uncharacterized protein n=1 Tax=Bionectria ochroleuca TaxID=29856 RepID=A0A0B7KDW7_BIOOC